MRRGVVRIHIKGHPPIEIVRGPGQVIEARKSQAINGCIVFQRNADEIATPLYLIPMDSILYVDWGNNLPPEEE